MTRCFLLMLILALLGLPTPARAATPACGITVLDTSEVAGEVTVQLRVRDPQCRDMLKLERSQWRVSEDGGQPIPDFTVEMQSTNEQTPMLSVAGNEAQPVMVAPIGATIGVVFDASKALNNRGGNDADQISEGRHIVQQFLNQAGRHTLADPQQVSVFIPIERSDQTLRPLTEFTADQNAVINELIDERNIRAGATNLYGAIQVAIQETGRVAAERGSSALVLVVGDGVDVRSDGTYEGLAALANELHVRVVSCGIGRNSSLERGGVLLSQLAAASGGRYYPHPDEATIATAFAAYAAPAPVAVHTLRYRTPRQEDEHSHTVQITVELPTGPLVAEQPLRRVLDAGVTLKPLGSVLQIPLLFALMFAIGLAAALTWLPGLRRDPRAGISRARTEKGK